MTDQNFTAVHISWLSRGFCARFHAAVAPGLHASSFRRQMQRGNPLACGKDPTYLSRRRRRRPNTSFGLLTGRATFGVNLTSAMRSREDEPRHGSRACPRVSPREAWATR